MTMRRKTSPSTRHDIVTLADLAPRQRVVGGSERRVFGADAATRQEDAMAGTRKTAKDLPGKGNVKGGKLAGNDNLTLVRAARPAKDLPPRKDVKGGKKVL
jgi:hypothetical protein